MAARNGNSTYSSWCEMRRRCTARNRPSWRLYGGRGITFCERWDSFDNFLADMGERPAGTWLDRVNNDGNYEPTNCRWATVSQQAFNRRQPKLTHAIVQKILLRYLHGETQKSIARLVGVDPSHISRIVRGEYWPHAQKGR